VVEGCLAGICLTAYIGEVQGSQGCPPHEFGAPWYRGTAAAVQDALPRQNKKRAGLHSSAGPYRVPEIRVYVQRIKKWQDDKCRFCHGTAGVSLSHALLHCLNEKLPSARAVAWEGKNPGRVRVLLTNARWERRYLRFLELPGVGRVKADGVDEDSARATQMDKWVVWEAEERVTVGGLVHLHLSLCFSFSFRNVCKGTHSLRFSDSALLSAEDLLCCGSEARGPASFLSPFLAT